MKKVILLIAAAAICLCACKKKDLEKGADGKNGTNGTNGTNSNLYTYEFTGFQIKQNSTGTKYVDTVFVSTINQSVIDSGQVTVLLQAASPSCPNFDTLSWHSMPFYISSTPVGNSIYYAIFNGGVIFSSLTANNNNYKWNAKIAVTTPD